MYLFEFNGALVIFVHFIEFAYQIHYALAALQKGRKLNSEYIRFILVIFLQAHMSEELRERQNARIQSPLFSGFLIDESDVLVSKWW